MNSNSEQTSNMLNLVDVRQATPYTCGVVLAQVILKDHGIDKRQDVLAK